ncbi:hypothetical protein [Methylobacterium oxalidis]|nr:hypothetical protein [Methylobacterium oxalidis]
MSVIPILSPILLGLLLLAGAWARHAPLDLTRAPAPAGSIPYHASEPSKEPSR